MEEQLWERFRDRFLESAKGRLSRALAMAAGETSNAAAVASELHALAGEASLLGAADVARIARAGERAAKAWNLGGENADEQMKACTSALTELDGAVRALATK